MAAIKPRASFALKLIRPWTSSARALRSTIPTKMTDNAKNYELTVAKPTGVSESNGTVLLLGWTGCVDKPLVKYSAIYQNMGFTVIRFSPSVNAIFGLRSATVLRKRVREMMNLMYQDGVVGDGNGKPVFIHAFSNGGSSMMRLLMDEFANGSKVRLKGCILDSAPTPITFISACRVAISVLPSFPGSKLLAPLLATTLYPYIQFCRFYNLFLGWFSGQPDPEYWRYFVWKNLSTQMDFSCPQLCLYSEADDITKREFVETFVKERVKRGVVVKVCLFKDSGHVGHFRKYPELYESAVRDFVRDCLDSGR